MILKKKSFEIALCQMNVVESKDENLERAVSMIREASVNGATLVVLPEMFNCPYDNESSWSMQKIERQASL